MMTGRFRVRCPGCGNVTDINTDIPCPKCGNTLAPMGAEIKLYRMGSPIGVAIGFGVYIDGQPCGHIGNKETVSYSVPFGTHNVRMTAGMSRKCVDMTLLLRLRWDISRRTLSPVSSRIPLLSSPRCRRICPYKI